MSRTLVDGYDAVLLDLDGTVYQGGSLIAEVYAAVQEMHRKSVPIRYVTNNASRSARAVANQLIGLGLPAEAVEVSTSAEAGATMLAGLLSAGSSVVVVGTEALAAEVEKVGLIPVRDSEGDPAGVIQGHSTETRWQDLAEAFLAIRRNAVWVACNDDVTLPTERGPVPGNGAMVAALRAASQRIPRVAGKPQRPLLEAAVNSAHATNPLLVGDRLETDIAGAVNSGIPAMLVFSGVSTPRELLFAPPMARPNYVAADLRALHRPVTESSIGEHASWKVYGDDTTIELAFSGEADTEDPMSALRALCASRWSLGSGPIAVQAGDDKAGGVLSALGLS